MSTYLTQLTLGPHEVQIWSRLGPCVVQILFPADFHLDFRGVEHLELHRVALFMPKLGGMQLR